MSSLAIITASIATAGNALADEPPTPRERTVFYGYQNMVVSYSGLLLFSARGLSLSATSIAGATVFLLGSPVVHGIHGDDGRRIAGSLAFDVALPFLGGLIASSTAKDEPGCANVNGGCLHDDIDRTSRGVMIGMAIAPLLDGLLLGWKTVPIASGLSPTISLARRDDPRSATTLGIRGVF